MSYEVLESRKTYEGKIVTITVDKLRMPDGSEAYRETVIRKKNAAGVLAVDTGWEASVCPPSIGIRFGKCCWKSLPV